jgi:hypothetical protein
MIIDNEEYFKLTISLIFYTIYFSNSSDSLKIAEYFGVLISNIFNIDTTKLIENLFKRKNNFSEKDKDNISDDINNDNENNENKENNEDNKDNINNNDYKNDVIMKEENNDIIKENNNKDNYKENLIDNDMDRDKYKDKDKDKDKNIYNNITIDRDKNKDIRIDFNSFDNNNNNNFNNNQVDLKIFDDKDLDYIEILEHLKGKSIDSNNNINNSNNNYILPNLDLDKFYNLDILAENIQINQIIPDSTNFMNSKLYSDFESVISLTPSLESQETGRTYKDIILINEDSHKNLEKKSTLFYPGKNKGNIIFFSNEHYYVSIRFIFCIYERLNKLGDSSAGFDYFTHNINENDTNNNNIKVNENNNKSLLRNFITIYKAFLHKKIDNLNLYEEYCREILGNESYFLLNVDKLINSVNKIR